MVNEERLRHMIKLSQFDQNDGKRCKPMMQYARKDYISLQLIGSFVTGTISYGLLLGLWALRSIDDLFAKINEIGIRGSVTALILFYVAFMALYLGATYIIFNVKYTDGRRKVKKYYGSLKKVNRMYEREERLKSTSSSEWE